MKRYRFRLETVLRVRRMQEDQARLKVALASAEATRAANRADEVAESYRSMPPLQVTGSPAELAAARFEPHWRAAGVTRAAAVAEQAELVRLEQVDEWRGKRQSVQVLERLDERRRAEHDIEVRRAEEAVVDDIVAGRFVPAGQTEEAR